jgi:large subunit ribosomal protein L3
MLFRLDLKALSDLKPSKIIKIASAGIPKSYVGMMDERGVKMPKPVPSIPYAILGKKIGMTQIFDANGEVVPVTVVQAGPCVVLQKKTADTDGYYSVQLGFDDKKKSRVLKPEAGHASKANTPVKRYIKELRLDEKSIAQFDVGMVLNASNFQVGDRIDVIGTSIGKGFQGVLKRHNFRSKPATHGTHEFFRHGGSIGMREHPGKVFKNKKMPGQMGNKRVTIQNLTVVAIDNDKNIIFIKGAVPGAKNAYLTIKSSVKGGFGPRDLKANAPAAE